MIIPRMGRLIARFRQIEGVGDPLDPLAETALDSSLTRSDVQAVIRQEIADQGSAEAKDGITVSLTSLRARGSAGGASRRLFLAALNVFAEEDPDEARAFGGRINEQLGDPRLARAFVLFMTRRGDVEQPLELLRSRQWRNQKWAESMIGRLTRKQRGADLDLRYGPDWEEARSAGEEELRSFGDQVLLREEDRPAVLDYLYSKARAAYSAEASRPLSREVVARGAQLLDILGEDSRLAKEVAKVCVWSGHLDLALDLLERHADDGDKRSQAMISDIKGLIALHHLGPDITLPSPASRYVPVPGRVLFVLHNSLPFDHGGYATRSHGLLRAVAESGFEVHAVTRIGYPHDRHEVSYSEVADMQNIDGVAYHRLRTPDRSIEYPGIFPGTLDYLEAFAAHLAGLVAELRPAIIHAASFGLNALAANAVARAFRIPSVYEVRGLWEVTRVSMHPGLVSSQLIRLISEIEVSAANGADRVFTLTSAMANELVRRGVERSGITLLPNAVDSTRFTPVPRDEVLASRLGLVDEVVIGYVGGLVFYEGLNSIMSALELLKAKDLPPFKFLLVGGGPGLEALRESSALKGLDEIVIFAGRVPHEEVESYYSLIDIAPFPRRALPVTEMVSPMKPFEAMAMEKAVVASDVAALKEIVSDHETGRLFRKDDVEHLAEVLGDLISSSEERAMLGRNARSWVVENRDWSLIAKTLRDTYAELGVELPARVTDDSESSFRV